MVFLFMLVSSNCYALFAALYPGLLFALEGILCLGE